VLCNGVHLASVVAAPLLYWWVLSQPICICNNKEVSHQHPNFNSAWSYGDQVTCIFYNLWSACTQLQDRMRLLHISFLHSAVASYHNPYCSLCAVHIFSYKFKYPFSFIWRSTLHTICSCCLLSYFMISNLGTIYPLMILTPLRIKGSGWGIKT